MPPTETLRHRLDRLLDEHPKADGSALASMVVESAETLEDLRALVFPWIEAVAEKQRIARRKRIDAAKREAKMLAEMADSEPCLMLPDPGRPGGVMIVRAERATPEQRATYAELRRAKH